MKNIKKYLKIGEEIIFGRKKKTRSDLAFWGKLVAQNEEKWGMWNESEEIAKEAHYK